MTLPLEGVLVVALEQAVAAPLATRHLCDAGACVIKVERVGDGDFARHYDDAVGPGYASWFVWLNRGKESVELDIQSETGRHTLDDLIAEADVVIQNLSPGAMERLGFDFPSLYQHQKGLITCSISGYGPDGPYRDRKAYDLLIQAEAGLVSLTGTPEAPAKAGFSAADIAGGMYAYSNILLALLRLGATRQGTHLEVSLFDALLEWLGHQMTFTRELGMLPPRAGARHATIAPYGPVVCAGGDEVLIAVQSAGEWERLCEALDVCEHAMDPRFVTNTDRLLNRGALDELIGERTATLGLTELVERLETAGLAWARVNDMAAVLNHPQLNARGRWCEIDTPVGPYTALRPPVDLADVELSLGRVPALGEHTRPILDWVATRREAQTAP